MVIRQYPSPNFSAGRRKYDGQTEQILAIIDHKTAGQYPGCRNWLCNPAAGASAHYLISRAGGIDQLVQDRDTSWHAGIVNRPNWALYSQMGYNPNRWTIGIEHEDYDGDGEPGLTEAQYQATLWLHRQLIAAYGIPVDTEHIVGHYRVDSVDRPNCPGPAFPWARLLADLGGGTVEDWQQKIWDAAAKAKLLNPADHQPNEGAPKWFVLAVALNTIRFMIRFIKGQEEEI